MTVYVVNRGIPEQLCERLVDELAFAYWSPSTVVTTKGGSSHPSSSRSSETAFAKYFPSQLSSALKQVEAVVTERFCLRRDSLADWQALRYGVGGEFGIHHDDTWGTLGRTTSVLVVIKAPAAGGQLEFPLEQVVIDPAPGLIVGWVNSWPDGVGNRLTEHRVVPVASGCRMSLVTWSSDRICYNEGSE